MPSLSLEEKGLILSMKDMPDVARDADTKLYFSSILGLDYDGNTSFIYQGSDDFVRTSILIRKITDYLKEIGLECDLDQKSRRIVEALVNSESELVQSREKGTDIQEEKANVPTVPGFVRRLKPYQVTSVNHAVAGQYVANFSVPGSGKTTVAYATFAILRANSVVEKIVVIGPRSSFMPWEEEYEFCFGKKPKSLRIIAGNQVESEDKVEDIDLILLTYQMASSITATLIAVLTRFKCLLILDESHHVKRFGGGSWSNTALRIAPYATRRLILTGTPMPNSLLDLWTQFTFLWPFRNLLGEPLAYKGIAEGRDGLERVRQIIQPFYTRITKSQLKLPQASFYEITVPLNRVQHAIYSAIAAKTLAEITDSPSDRMRLREWRRNKVVRLLQAASNPSLLTEYSEEFRIPPLHVEGMPVVQLIQQYSNYEIPSKIVKAETLTRDLLEKGEKVIVWNTFIHNIKTLERMLADRDPIIIYGDIPKDENEDELVNREKLIREFKADTKPRVLIANPSSLAESVSLHRVCKHAIYVDRTFNCGQYIQSLDRIHRIGLKPNEKVIYHILVARNTIDEVVETRLGEKYRNMLNVLNDDLPIVDFDTTVSDVSDAEFEKDFEAVHQHLLGLKTGEKSD
jgi:SNF2 family DNA or RNA helicase